MTVYRDITVSGEDAQHLREIETLLRRLADATGADKFALYADDLGILARRYERQQPIEIAPGVYMNPVSRALAEREPRPIRHTTTDGALACDHSRWTSGATECAPSLSANAQTNSEAARTLDRSSGRLRLIKGGV